uniref:Methyltransf_11 domain-containing protein n=1 Tax=Syphacia muris TaxID=451379 RepID=A0A0N5AV04_9BILA
MALKLADAEDRFLKLIDEVDPRNVAEFLNWINDSFVVVGGGTKQSLREKGDIMTTVLEDSLNNSVIEATALLRKLAVEIRTQVPQTAVFDSETTVWPKIGLDSDCKPETTIHVDSFLYDDDDVEDLAESGLISRNYCAKCGSRDVNCLTFISHSLGISQLRYMFTVLVPLNQAMRGRLILDIGSRLGAVLYAVYYYSGGTVNAVGIEMNSDLCKLQKKVIKENGMDNSLCVIEDDVRNQGDVVSKADVIVMNNVFSFFLPVSEQLKCFEFLHEHIKPGAVIISNPTMEELTESLSLPFEINYWLDKVNFISCFTFFVETELS